MQALAHSHNMTDTYMQCYIQRTVYNVHTQYYHTCLAEKTLILAVNCTVLYNYVDSYW